MALLIRVSDINTIALLDTKAARSFMSKLFARKANLLIRPKKQSYKLTSAIGETISGDGIIKETVPLKIII